MPLILLKRSYTFAGTFGQALIDEGLLLSSEMDLLGTARLLLARGAARNGRDARTPLHLACANGSLSLAAMLIEHGADVTGADGDGLTPLGAACLNGHFTVARMLVAKGAAIDGELRELLNRSGRPNASLLLFESKSDVTGR